MTSCNCAIYYVLQENIRTDRALFRPPLAKVNCLSGINEFEILLCRQFREVVMAEARRTFVFCLILVSTETLRLRKCHTHHCTTTVHETPSNLSYKKVSTTFVLPRESCWSVALTTNSHLLLRVQKN